MRINININANKIEKENNDKINRDEDSDIPAEPIIPEEPIIPAEPIIPDEPIIPEKGKIEMIDLFGTIYIENIIESLAKLLRETGTIVNVNTRDLENEDIDNCFKNKNRYLFICCPQYFLQVFRGTTYPVHLRALPENKYFIYQLEKLDIGSPFYLSKNIIDLIKKSHCTFDYSEVNLSFYPEECSKKVSVLLPPVVEYNMDNIIEKNIDILFCGRETEKREKIFQALRLEGYNVVNVTDVFGKALTALIKKTKIFLNLHHDESASLETCRINEAVMSPDTHIISEKSGIHSVDSLYEDRIHFIERIENNNINELICKVKELLMDKEIKTFDSKKWNIKTIEIIKQKKEFIHLYPVLFNKYILKLRNILDDIPYEIKLKSIFDNDFICHLHIYNIDTFYDCYGKHYQNLINEFNIIITYSIGIIPITLLTNNVSIIRIENKGYDIGGKLCALEFIKNENIIYNYILFLHSKSNIDSRNEYFEPLIKNIHRIKLNKMLLKNKNLLGIFPNIIHGVENIFTYHDAFCYNDLYYTEILSYLNIEDNFRIFSEGNCFYCNKNVIDYIFKNNYNYFYNILNHENSFDANWVNIYYNYNTTNYQFLYNEYINKNLFGNNNLIKHTNKAMPDGMIEHVFERIWLNVIKKLKGKYLILDKRNLVDFYDIKINAIYFPQFHEIEENNKFWGKGFTEWTLLKPYNSNTIINDIKYDILKPHTDIGYYDLSNVNTLKNQIKLANEHNINGFVIYHYWFDDNTKILYKPLEYFLNTDISFPFCISWANETWSRRWDGSNSEVLLKQEYGNDNSMLLHINYLIPFFKKNNYMKTVNNECIFYIYNISHISEYNGMILIWKKELDRHNIKIKIIFTENSFIQNHNNSLGEDNFIFEPMYSSNYVNLKKQIDKKSFNKKDFDLKFYVDNNEDLRSLNEDYLYEHFITYGINENRTFKFNNKVIDNNMCINYKDIIKNYSLNKYNTTNKHLGLPLYWNNIVRRKNLPFLYIEDFSMSYLEEMLLLLLSEHVNKYSNIHNLNECKNKYDNIIIVNAWNEWNEQAVLEPNNINGYENLETICKIVKNL
jgi:hypothetical protein